MNDGHIPMEPPGCEELCTKHQQALQEIARLQEKFEVTQRVSVITYHRGYDEGFDAGFDAGYQEALIDNGIEDVK